MKCIPILADRYVWLLRLGFMKTITILAHLSLNEVVSFFCRSVYLVCNFPGNCTVPGQYRDAGENVCRDCPRGQWQNQKWQTSCIDCNVGLTTRYTGTSDPANCLCKYVCLVPVFLLAVNHSMPSGANWESMQSLWASLPVASFCPFQWELLLSF